MIYLCIIFSCKKLVGGFCWGGNTAFVEPGTLVKKGDKAPPFVKFGLVLNGSET